MSINYKGDVSEVICGLSILEDSLGLEGNYTVRLSKCERGFNLCVYGECAEISYNTPSDLFRAISFASDAFKRGESLELSESPTFSTCGVFVDVSRGAVLKVETVKLIMRKMARMGMNELMLYTEDTYELEDYPYFGYMRGRYTKKELKEIVAYGNKLGIDTVPCIQTLGHLAKPLRWSAFNDVKQSPDILMIGEEETYKLIEDMIKTSRECFTTKRMHIGMDEAHDVGLGKYLAKHGYKNRFDILCQHLERVKKIADKYDFEPMMWSDMFFRLASKQGDYYDMEAVFPEDLPEKIPEGISQVYWDYYNHSEKLYDNIIKQHLNMKCPIIFAGGAWTWGVPSVNYGQSFRATLPALKVCRQYGIDHVFACLWSDDGAECDILEGLYGLQLFSELNYRGNIDGLSDNFKICCDCDSELFLGFDTDGEINIVEEHEKYNFRDTENQIIVITKQALYQNPLMGLFDKNFEELPLSEHYKKLYEKFNLITPTSEWQEMYDCHKALLRVMTEKCDIGNRLLKAYKENNREELSCLVGVLSEIEANVEDYKLKREKLWYKNNKPFGFENLSKRLSHLSDMCRIARARVTSYLGGEVERLEELEAERLLYNVYGGAYEHECFSSKIMLL